jgi:hypothetical protein
MPRRRHSLLYVVYLRSPLWRLRRRIWIIRALDRCEQCRRRRRLTIHHRTYQRLGHERRADIAVLCWSCHQSQHPSRAPASTRGPWWPIARVPRAWLSHRRIGLRSRVLLFAVIAVPVLIVLASGGPSR